MSKNADKRSSSFTPSLINKDDLALKQVIGQGFYGVVIQATWRHPEDGEIECAVKILKQTPDKLLKEIVNLQKLSHENIVQLYGVCLEEPLHMVLELCEGGTLLDRLKDHSKPKPLVTTLLKYAIQIAGGMYYLEAKGCVHRDLAARNILLTKDEQKAKISDFGLSRHLRPDQSQYEMSESVALPFPWCPPESLRNKKFSSHSDVWAFGVTLWEMFQYGTEDPWNNLSLKEVLEKIEAGKRLSKPLYCPQEIYNIMFNCWDFVPQSRPNFSTLINKLKEVELDIYDLNKKEKTVYEIPIGSDNINTFIIIGYNNKENVIAQDISSGKFCLFSLDGELSETENSDSNNFPSVQPSISSSGTNTNSSNPKPPVAKKPTFLSDHKIVNDYSNSFPKSFPTQPIPTAPYHHERTSTPPLPTPPNHSNKNSWLSHLREIWYRIIANRKYLIVILICIIIIIAIITAVLIATKHHSLPTKTTAMQTKTSPNYVSPTPSLPSQNYSTTSIIQTTQASLLSCPSKTWHHLNSTNKCYYFGFEVLNWDNSLTACQSLYSNATLVSIHSYDENQQLCSLYNSSGDTSHHYKINIGLRLVGENYTWVDGSNFNYSLLDTNNGIGITLYAIQTTSKILVTFVSCSMCRIDLYDTHGYYLE
uniref:non-specific protein-tyrosine kinase n=1 Tax=Acrobeloides nanus TaxID=290746 RepID=A0A914DQX4_9BILA